MHALRELILKRPANITRYLMELLHLSFHERTEVRSQATQYVKRLYERQDLKETIEVKNYFFKYFFSRMSKTF